MPPDTRVYPAASDASSVLKNGSGGEMGGVSNDKVSSSPSSAFAALSLADFATDFPAASSSSTTSNHLDTMNASTSLVLALDEARRRDKKLIRSTGHLVPRSTVAGSEDHHHLLSWKVAEFAYRKSTGVGAELPTLARGLFTERVKTPAGDPSRHRIVVRGYDKFFNLGEMPWTKPASISTYTTGPYVMTFKENGCIIFVAALSPSQILVTSKHSLGSIEGTETTHAQMGEHWLQRHLSSVGKTVQQLAAELWRRNETAAFELCDDAFEEHVLEYSQERSGLHLHGLNANAVHFSTRSMPEVDEFAKTWGFIQTRWIEMQTLEEVQSVTAHIEKTGAWEGEAIEGFVIRTHMPSSPVHQADVVSPPYRPGQTWFYKVKFDEPYLMYRDWRELTRKMLSQRSAWEKQVQRQPSSTPTKVEIAAPTPDPAEEAPEASGEPQSKAARKRERKRANQEAAQAASALRLEAQNAGLLPPEMPQPKSKRPETRLFIQWCYDRLYGSDERKAKPQPALFANLGQNKGIIAMRNAFLQYMATNDGQSQLAKLGGNPTSQDLVQPLSTEPTEDDRPFTKTVLAPIAVPGSGKTILAVALTHLFPSLVGHVQSDDFKSKKGFLASVEKDLRTHATHDNYVLFADKNNHLYQHRDELIELSSRLSSAASQSEQSTGKKQRQAAAPIGRIRTVALAYNLDAFPLNTLHRICASRIEQRGSNHQSLRADPSPHSMAGLKFHEQILWRFLEGLQPFASSMGGEGAQGWGDAKFDLIVPLKVANTPRQNIDLVVQTLCPILGWSVPDDARIEAALTHASDWKVESKAPRPSSQAPKIEPANTDENHASTGKDRGTEASQSDSGSRPSVPRYFGVAVELDIKSLLDQYFATASVGEGFDEASAFYTSVREGGRLNLRPHITLVHSSNLSSAPCTDGHQVQPKGQGETELADRKWAFCTQLVGRNASTSQPPREYVFELTLHQILYERDSLLTFPVHHIRLFPVAKQGDDGVLSSETQLEEQVEQSFRALTHNWTPHITVATRANDVRPYRANQVVQTYLNTNSANRNGAPYTLENGGSPPNFDNNRQRPNDDSSEPPIFALSLSQPVTVQGRIFGMA